MSEMQDRKELAASYNNITKAKRRIAWARLTPDQRAFAAGDYASGGTNKEYYRQLTGLLAARDADPAADPRPLSAVLREAFSWYYDAIIPEGVYASVDWAFDHLTEMPFMRGYDRRAYRSSLLLAYRQYIVDVWKESAGDIAPFPLADVMLRRMPEDALAYFEVFTPDTPWYYTRRPGYTAWQVAEALDRGDTAVEDAVRVLLTGDSTEAFLSREAARGIIMSHRADFHELLCKLLLSAGLQEGLRQAICEEADQGSREGLAALLKTVADNGLIRFSSVKRAVCTWLGTGEIDSRSLQRITDKIASQMHLCLHDPAARDTLIGSGDCLSMHVGLWAVGIDSAEKMGGYLADMLKDGDHLRRVFAGEMLESFRHPILQGRLACLALTECGVKDDPEELAPWVNAALDALTCLYSEIIRDTVTRDGTVSRMFIPDAAALCRSLFAIAETYKEKAKTFNPLLLPWWHESISRGLIIRTLAYAAWLTGDDDTIDRACAYFKEADNRDDLVRLLLTPPRTPVRRAALIFAVGDSATDAREAAFKQVKGLKLTNDEIRLLEGMYRLKATDIRKNVTELIEKQNDEALSASIGRLLADKKEDVRCAGLELLARRGKRTDLPRLLPAHLPRVRELHADPALSAREKALTTALVPRDEPVTDNKKTTENTLWSESDFYKPETFDEEFVQLCLDTLNRYFPENTLASCLPDASRWKKLMTAAAAAFSPVTGDCRTCGKARADVRLLSDWLDRHREDTYPDGHGGTAVLDYDRTWQSPNEAWRMASERWYEESGMTPERLLRMKVAAAVPAPWPRYAGFAAKSAILLGAFMAPGTDIRSSAGTAMLVAQTYRIPEADCFALTGAACLWFLYAMNDGECVTPADMHGSSAPAFVEHAFTYEPAGLLYGLAGPYSPHGSNARRDYTGRLFEGLFPLTVAVGWKCSRAHIAFRESPAGQAYVKTLFAKYAYFQKEIKQNASETIDWRMCVNYSVTSYVPGVREFLWAGFRGLITERALYAFLLGVPQISLHAAEVLSRFVRCTHEKGGGAGGRSKYAAQWAVQTFTNFFGHADLTDEEQKLLAYAEKVYVTLAYRTVLEAELSRGDSQTKYSRQVRGIERLYGAETFARILEALGRETLVRNTEIWAVDPDSRKSCLSHLLAVCIPGPDDNADTLRAALKGRKISDTRLIEAAMYTPEWQEIVEEVLGKPGLASTCRYFMAHMNDTFDDVRKAIIARYTPLSVDELKAGAFDVAWFRTAYETVGAETFDIIYNAAKYITEGSRHTRARKYADAALGRLSVDETEAAVADKRNKDLLMAYAVIPLAGEDDILRRYLFIQKFRKESKQFGSQRASSEQAACDMALTNLAVNAGYADVMRLTLRMETRAFEDSRDLLNDTPVEDVVLRLVIDETGRTDVVCGKDGKALKSIPARLKKHETVLRMTEAKKALTEQYRRARAMLENAMEDGTVFSMDELNAMRTHPVVFPMLSRLVCKSDEVYGLPDGVGLTDCLGNAHVLPGDAPVVLAHPVHLYTAGNWRAWQQFLFDRQVVQPFKQVFRELYIPTEEEKESDRSLRYAGNQIIPSKAAAVLKTRRWVADVEAGLQKVYYKENLIAELYALADWFSPSDIEAPTLEYVVFTDRRNGKEVKLCDVPPVIFSEVMRDVDLCVSVAHAGQVDPETSHSTMQMRADLLDCFLPLFKLGNVRIERNHALIKGRLADYSVHLGSGVVHQTGGTMIPVIPVHSQHNGKVFLPFADEDPKTAEVVSKVLLFAEDAKIKDPSILEWIQRVR